MKDLEKLREWLDAVIEQNEKWRNEAPVGVRREFYDGKVVAYLTVRHLLEENIQKEVS